VIREVELALRGGFNTPVHNTLESSGFSVGLGVKFLGYQFQYAFKGDTDAEAALGYTHRFDLLVNFMKLTKEMAEKHERKF
jgi:hypothetical protein